MAALGSVLGLLGYGERIPRAIEILAIANRAKAGDPEALAYIRDGGWTEALDLVSPGSGEAARTAVVRLNDILRELRGGDVVLEGDYAMRRPPWQSFIGDLVQRRYGAHIILGPPGQGKTSLAKKLAANWATELSYKIEAVNMYGDDLPPGAVTISTSTLVRRIVMLKKYLASLAVRDEGEGEEEDELDVWSRKWASVPAVLPPGKRVIILEEASLSLSVSPSDPVRNASIAAIANCRHIPWIVIFIGQMASQIPPGLFAQTAKWTKRPAGDEIYADRQDFLTRSLWQQAMVDFAALERSPWYRRPYNTPKAWASVIAPPADSFPAFKGMVPFTPVGVETSED